MISLMNNLRTGHLDRALRILKLVSLDGMTKEERSHIVVEAYSNCREQGFCVSVLRGHPDIPTLMLAFAEARGSDDIVVWEGTSDDFDSHNIPEDSARSHSFESEKAAAVYIQRMVRGWRSGRTRRYIGIR